ncbi:tyrosine-type recombinase/integrase, partial [Mesorhizobium sp. WSM3626]|uniref:tyrosine-type recombinase/integrase n=1 Tax=Mesorhizobium sp. WSM3626 TaxID=1040987 RepID=UPI0004852136
DITTPMGVRDRAVLLLLARLGLRAGDISGMRLDDIDWSEGTLRVRGKGRREVRLPLPRTLAMPLSIICETPVRLPPVSRFSCGPLHRFGHW